ncbi:branched-chain amino acid ABC transporter permease [Thermoproteota archaeon]
MGPLSTRYDYLIITAISLISFALVYLYLHRTKTGLAIRAVEQDRMAAQLMGINLTKIRLIIFGLASALAGGISGLLLSTIIAIQPTFGDNILLPSYMIVVVGGLGSIRGTILGAFLIATLQQVVSLFLDIFWANAIVYLFVLVLLTFRPMGLAGVTSGA